MKKPEFENHTYLDWHKCTDYIEKTHKIRTRDYANCFGPGGNTANEYQDFWHWIIDVCDVHRGATMELYEGIEDGAKPWQKEILALYLKEFGRGPYLTDW